MQRTRRAMYLNMIGGLTDSAIRGRLLAMDLTELRADDQLRRAAFAEAAPPRMPTSSICSCGSARRQGSAG
jgi:hypothetical protein